MSWFHGTNPGPYPVAASLAVWHLGEAVGGLVADSSGNNRPLSVDGAEPLRTVSGPKDLAWRLGTNGTRLHRSPEAAVWGSMKQSNSVQFCLRVPAQPQPGPEQYSVLLHAGGRWDDASAACTGENVSMFVLAMKRSTREILYFWDNQSNTSQGVFGTYILPLNKWTHVCAVRTYAGAFSTSIQLYIDGQPIANSGSKPSPISSGRTGSSMGFHIGHAPKLSDGSMSHVFLGDMDSIRVDTGVMTAEEVTAAFNDAMGLGVPPDRRRRAAIVT